MKSGAILWLGGWASNIVCWKNEIEILYPEQAHQFLDVHAMINDELKLFEIVNTFYSHASSEFKTASVIGWSMGSLVLHKMIGWMREENGHSKQEIPKDLKLISLCPIFDFCRTNGPWSENTLTYMIRQLEKKQEAVLQDFWTKMKPNPAVNNSSKGNLSVTVQIEKTWLEQVKNYSLQELEAGLEYLRDTKIELSDFPKMENHFLLSSQNDPIAPFNSITLNNLEPHFNQWYEYPEGHLPFLHYPELVKKLL